MWFKWLLTFIMWCKWSLAISSVFSCKCHWSCDRSSRWRRATTRMPMGMATSRKWPGWCVEVRQVPLTSNVWLSCSCFHESIARMSGYHHVFCADTLLIEGSKLASVSRSHHVFLWWHPFASETCMIAIWIFSAQNLPCPPYPTALFLEDCHLSSVIPSMIHHPWIISVLPSLCLDPPSLNHICLAQSLSWCLEALQRAWPRMTSWRLHKLMDETYSSSTELELVWGVRQTHPRMLWRVMPCSHQPSKRWSRPCSHLGGR